MGRILFVTGTDTGVGKTLVAAGVIRALRARGESVCGVKPFSTGCGGGTGPADAALLEDAAESGEPLNLLAPVRFDAPLSPLAAARLESRGPGLETAASAVDELASRRGAVVMEGVGGIMAPLAPRSYVLDFAARWRPRTVVVARPGLGTLNHVFLTARALESLSIPLAAVVLSDSPGCVDDPSRESNPSMIADCLGVPVFALPRLCGMPGDEAAASRVFEGVLKALLR